MTLDEAIEKTANNNGWDTWGNLFINESKGTIVSCLEEAAKLYARSKWDESQELLILQVAQVFKENAHKADLKTDEDVFNGIADMFHRFPRNEFIP